jgi:endonuclease/exonuclease/phosphatase family metal-dependent hydrolase
MKNLVKPRLKKYGPGVAFFLLCLLLLWWALPHVYRTRPSAGKNKDQPARHMKVVTFNVFDFYTFPDHSRRMKEIGRFLARLDPDVVGLQEAFVPEDRKELFNQLKNTRLRYNQYFPSGLVGSGLCILSAYPIERTDFLPYSANGKWYKPWHGDQQAGKGVAWARLKLPTGKLDFFNTHLIARYADNDEYYPDRCRQVDEMMSFIGKKTANKIPALLVGDLNFHPKSPEHQQMLRRHPMTRLVPPGDGIDYILALENSACTVTLLSSESISPTTTDPGQKLPLSNHPCVISKIQISNTKGFITP